MSNILFCQGYATKYVIMNGIKKLKKLGRNALNVCWKPGIFSKFKMYEIAFLLAIIINLAFATFYGRYYSKIKMVAMSCKVLPSQIKAIYN
jgi:hypothetical protein